MNMKRAAVCKRNWHNVRSNFLFTHTWQLPQHVRKLWGTLDMSDVTSRWVTSSIIATTCVGVVSECIWRIYVYIYIYIYIYIYAHNSKQLLWKIMLFWFFIFNTLTWRQHFSKNYCASKSPHPPSKKEYPQQIIPPKNTQNMIKVDNTYDKWCHISKRDIPTLSILLTIMIIVIIKGTHQLWSFP